jgi:uncharacterized protein YegP (UPF0339 family)
MKVIIYKDDRGEWRWRVRAKNGNILADSGEGYSTKSSCRRAWKRFVWHMDNRSVHIEYGEG